jgi:hypothetical protein
MPDLPPTPARERAIDYASVATLALARAGVPADVRLTATGIGARTRVESADRMRFKLWVNSQPDLPYLW